MTRKDYKAIAEVVETRWQDHRDQIGVDEDQIDCSFQCLITGLAEVMARDNPRFDRFKFEQACGYYR